MIYCLYLYDRHGTCLLYRRWNVAALKPSTGEEKAVEHEKKNLFGLLFQMRQFIREISLNRAAAVEGEPFHSFATDYYKLHYFETQTGLRFVLMTDKRVGRLTDTLRHIFRLYVDFVVSNPLQRPGVEVDSPLFIQKLDNVVQQLPFFSSPA